MEWISFFGPCRPIRLSSMAQSYLLVSANPTDLGWMGIVSQMWGS